MVSELITELLEKRKVRAKQMLTTRKNRKNLEVVSSHLEVEGVVEDKNQKSSTFRSNNKFQIA